MMIYNDLDVWQGSVVEALQHDVQYETDDREYRAKQKKKRCCS